MNGKKEKMGSALKQIYKYKYCHVIRPSKIPFVLFTLFGCYKLLAPYSLLSGSRINLRHVSLELIKNFLDDKEIGNKGMRET